MKNIKPSIRFSDFYENWYVSKFSDVATVNMGQSPNGENYTNNPNDHILVQGNADIKKGWVQPRVWTTQVTKTADPGDIILCVRAPVGDVSKTTYKVVLGRGVAGIKGNEFIYYLLYKMKIEGYWTKFSTGSTFESINSNDIKEAVIAVPIKEEQTKIGLFFKNLDDTISLHQQELEILKQTKQGFLQKMFPKKGQLIPEIRLSGYKENWKEMKFKNLAEIRRGLTYKPKDVDKTGVRVLRSSNIKGDSFILKNDDVFVKQEAVNIDYAKENEILITSANGSSNLVGKHALIKKLDHPTVHGGFMLIASAKTPYFVNTLMSTEWYDRFIKVHVSGGNGAIGNLNKNNLENYSVMVPSIEEQIKIGEFFRQLDEVIELKEKELEALKETKKGFLQKMFV